MTDTLRIQNHKRTAALLMTALTVSGLIFATAMMVKVGFGLGALWEPDRAEAAPQSTATPMPVVTAAPPKTPSVLPTVISTPEPITPEPVVAEPSVTPEITPEASESTAELPLLGPRLVAGASGVNVRSGPSTAFEKVGYLAPDMEAGITGQAADWWQIDYEGESAWVFAQIVTAVDAEEVPVVTPPALERPTETVTPVPGPAPIWAIDEARWIDVDLSAQLLTAYEGTTPVKSYLVSTGLPQTPTPVGQYRIWIKMRYDDMAGADYYIKDVPFVMYFYGGYGLHGVTWHGNFGHPMSHGCVNQPTDMAEWLFAFADVDTLVNIHE